MKSILYDLRDLFFPSCCLLCARPIYGVEICAGCRPCFASGSGSRFLGLYSGDLRKIISTCKYRPSRKLLSYLCAQFEDLFKGEQNRFDSIVPIPPSWPGYRRRLFDQTRALARSAQRGLDPPPPIIHALGRSSSGKQQARLRRAARIRNAEHCFRVRKSVQGHRILLIDDVVTTGATTAAAGRLLLEAGARSVELYALARSRYFDRSGYRIHGPFAL